MDWIPIEQMPSELKDGRPVFLTAARRGRRIYRVDHWARPEDHAGYTGWGEFNTQFWPPTHYAEITPPAEA
jgi:hypothetical protein